MMTPELFAKTIASIEQNYGLRLDARSVWLRMDDWKRLGRDQMGQKCGRGWQGLRGACKRVPKGGDKDAAIKASKVALADRIRKSKGLRDRSIPKAVVENTEALKRMKEMESVDARERAKIVESMKKGLSSAGQKEVDRLAKSAESAASWQNKMANHREALKPMQESKDKEIYDRVIANQPTWSKFEGVDVLRVRDSNFVAVPNNGRKKSKTWSVIDLNDRRDIVTQLPSKDVDGWLARQAMKD